MPTFAFRFDPLYRVLAAPFGVTPRTASVDVDLDGARMLRARFGPWRVETPLLNVASAAVTGPYALVKTAGPARVSFADRGLTFATNRDRGVCLTFADAVAGIAPTGRIRHPGLTVTVDDVDGLVAAIAGA